MNINGLNVPVKRQPIKGKNPVYVFYKKLTVNIKIIQIKKKYIGEKYTNLTLIKRMKE